MFGALKKRISRTFSRAGEIFSGPNPTKQFRNAIVDRDEDKAITLYTKGEGDQPPLVEELHPSKPFPSKKNQPSDSPLFLAAKYALEKLVMMLLEKGGDPSAMNSRNETCLHAVCSMADHTDARAAILDTLYNWVGIDEDNKEMEKVSLNRVDVDGNSAIHNAAGNGLVSCVEKLVGLGAIISIVNKNNITCCEVADENNHKELALMLELALVFQPEDDDLSSFDRFASDTVTIQSGKLILDTKTLTASGMSAYVEECIHVVSTHIGWMNARQFRCRAEALLNLHSWDVQKLVEAYLLDANKVLADAKMTALVAAGDKKEEKTEESAKGDVSEAEEKPRADDMDVSASPQKELLSEATVDEGKPSSQEDQQGDKLADAADAQVDLDDIVIGEVVEEKEVEECGMCMICADNMLRACDISLFVKDQVKEPERRALTCLSGHSFCVSCWSSHAQVQLSEHSSGAIPCPAYKCGEILDVQWAPILLKSQELVNRLLTHRMRHIVDCAGFKQCPIDNCHVTVYVPEEGRASSRSQSVPGTPASSAANVSHNIPQAGVCANGHMFCLSCSSPAHTPCSCSDYLQWQTLIQEELKSTSALTKDATNNDEIANALWVAANTKRCPRCNTAIEKDEGCNHMSCRKCRKEFCWICMQDWSLHSDNTGGYFQCNRFVQQPATGSNESGDVWSEERGNAHAEAMRARERSMKMARFIHHYTRYKAHSDSMTMEVRMHKETLRRISDGLKACREKKLLWLQPAVPNPLNRNEEPTESLDVGDFINKISTPSKFDPTMPPTNSNPVLKHCIQCERSIQFLDDGFEELLKTRSFLQWSYAYAYFEFIDSDDFDYANNRRRSRWTRARLEDHRTSFELLQADLESTVETLSDVVARRRLRAAERQIIQATRAAKQKRVELESLIIAYSSAKLSALQSEASTPSRQATPGSVGSRFRISTPNRSATRSNNRGTWRRNERRQDNDGDGYDDLASLLLNLEFQDSGFLSILRPSSRNTPGRTTSNAANDDTSNAVEGNSADTAANADAENDVRARLANLFASNEATSSTPTSLSSAMNEIRQRRRQARLGGNDTPARSESAEAGPGRVSFTMNSGGGEMLDSDHSDDEAGGMTRGDRDMLTLARRAEEAAALNRAILMSLQDPARDGSTTSVNQEQIDLLVSMGFTAEQSEQALRESGGNVDLAANRLLGI